MGDGVILRLNHMGTAGVHELWRLVDHQEHHWMSISMCYAEGSAAVLEWTAS